MTNCKCIRCLRPIPGIPVIVGEYYFGKGCYEVYYRRMKLRASLNEKCEEFTNSSCLTCPKLKLSKCPLEEKYNYQIGRKR